MQKPKVIQNQYGVIVVCENERQQREVYERLAKIYPELKIKVVCV